MKVLTGQPEEHSWPRCQSPRYLSERITARCLGQSSNLCRGADSPRDLSKVRRYRKELNPSAYRPVRPPQAQSLRVRGPHRRLECLHLHHPMPTSGRHPHRPLPFSPDSKSFTCTALTGHNTECFLTSSAHGL